MAKERRWIDISGVPELLRIVEDVRRSREPRVLRRDSEDLAILIPTKPAPTPGSKRSRAGSDREAFLSSAGSWKGIVDTKELIAAVHESRRRSSRPPIEL